MSGRTHESRIGDLDFRDWDKAVLLSVGSVYDETENRYYVPISQIIIGENTPEEFVIDRASIIFKKSEPTHLEFDLPAFRISRDDVSIAQRLLGIVEQYRIPCEGATAVSYGDCLGATDYETKPQARPYDFSYTFEVWSRYRNVAQVLIQILMARFPVHGNISVVDSLNVEREYYVSQEGVSDLTEISNLVDRIVGYSMSIRIQGEMTLDSVPVCNTAFTGDTFITPIDPLNPGVDPGPGGLYADGKPELTLEALEGSNNGC